MLGRQTTSIRPLQDIVKDDLLTLEIPVLRILLWLISSIILILVVLPSLYLIIWAFWGTETVGIISSDFTLKWITKILFNPEWRESLLYSIGLAILVSLLSSLILTIHFYFMRFAPPWVERFSYLMTIVPIILPPVIFALALRLFGSNILLPEMILLTLGHIVFVVPIQYFVFETAQERIPSEMLFAGTVMGANSFRNIFFVYLPMLSNTIWVAFLVGFFFSFDEIVIAAFIIDSPLVTIPKRLWDQIHRSMEPNPAVVASILLIFYIILLFIVIFVKTFRKNK